jgi:hypothetical protein
MVPIINKSINPKTHGTESDTFNFQEGPEGFSIEAAFCLFYIGLNLYIVLTVVAISMVLTGNTRKYRKRKSMSLDPEAPWCECGEYKCQKSEGRFRKKCYRCRTNKDGASAAATGRSSNTETEAGPSQQQEAPSNTLRRSSGSVLSPKPTVRGPRPSGSTWNGSAFVFTDPNTTHERQQTARGGRGFSTLQQSWLTDFSWLRCEKDPDLMAQTDGRCSTESEDGVACPGCTWCSRLYCVECRNRTGNVFSAAFGSRTFKRAECLRHADRWHRKELGYHSVPTLLTKEAEKVKQNRVRTIFAVLFLAVEKIALHKLPALAKLVFQMGFKTSDDAHDHLGLKYMGKDAARDFLFCLCFIIREWVNLQARNSPMVGIMVDESTDISQKKVPQTAATDRLQS